MKKGQKIHIQSVRFYREQKEKILKLKKETGMTENEIIRKAVDKL